MHSFSTQDTKYMIFLEKLSTLFTDLSTDFVYNFSISTTYPRYQLLKNGLNRLLFSNYQQFMHNLWITLAVKYITFPQHKI